VLSIAQGGYNDEGGTVSKATLQVRKQQLVRGAIYEAAIDLFGKKGFDQTTVEEVAQAAGVSRRSFFRYYPTKDDLLAQGVVLYGAALTSAISRCPATLEPLDLVREMVLSGVKHISAQPLTREIIEIAQRSALARQAYASRLREVEDSVSDAFARRLESATNYDLKPRLLANLTIVIMNVAITSWFNGEYPDLSTAAMEAFSMLTRIVCHPARLTQPADSVATVRKVAERPRAPRPASAKR
jgi:AcrR family transcriptional regulator